MDRTGKQHWTATVAGVLLIGLAAPLWAETGETKVENAAALQPASIEERMQQVISIDFKEAEIDDVLMILAQQADVDIIKSPKVQGKVTAVLNNIPLSEALDNILEVHGFGYVVTDHMIRVVPKEEVFEAREQLITRVYRITYARVPDVVLALKGVLSEQGAISANPGTSNIIVTDVESKIKAIDLFIDEIDRVTPQIMVESRIYDVTSTDNLDIGIQWQAGTATSYGNPPATGGTLGNQYGTLGNVIDGAGSVSDPHLTGAFSGNTSNTATSGLLRYGILNSNINIDAALRATQEDIRAKLLANPRILVLDNEQAEIKIVEEIPYQELTETSAGGQIGTTQFRDVGVELRVTPHLTRDSLIRLELNPKFSVRTGDVLSTGNSNVSPQPIIATRETLTTALIEDGQTVVIGGLKKQDVRQQKNKIPLLGDLPLLGGLFRFEGESIVNSELVIFITPHVIVNPVLSTAEQRYLKETEVPAPREPQPRISRAEK